MLPKINTLESYAPLYRDVSVWLPALREICCRHGLNPDRLRQAPPGSNIVFWVEPGYLIKLFAPMWAADAQREMVCLHTLEMHPVRLGIQARPLDAPRVVAEGSIEGWPYLIWTRMAGQPMDEIWDDLVFEDREQLVQDLGWLMSGLHQAPTRELEMLGDDWPAFLDAQVQGCLARQKKLGVSPAWQSQLAAFFEDLPLLDDLRPAFLHADLNPEHLFCQQGSDGWHITGVIDFGDAMLGHPFYEFVAPGHLLLASTAPQAETGSAVALRRAMLLAYGFQADELNDDLSRRLLAFTLLHRFASLPDTLKEFGDHPPVDLPGLQRGLWGLQV